MALGNVSRTVAITSIASSFDNPYPDSACLPQASTQNLIASKTNGLLSQHNGTVGGHCNRVLKMRAQTSVFRHRGPAITQYLHIRFARVHHGLDRDHHSLAQLLPLTAAAVIRHLRIFMQPRADAMPDKFPHDTEAVRFHDFLHGSADIAQIRSHLYGADAAFKRCLRYFEKALRFLTSGYKQDPEKLLNGAMFSVTYDEMVVVKDIEFYSLCEHHMLPFFGKVHVAYIPNGKVIGLSKIPRLVEVFARRLQVQERLTRQIADAIQEAIEPQGVGVVIEARHLCMMMRGVEKQNSSTVTSAMIGVFQKQNTRAEFLSLVRERTNSGI